MIEGNIWMHSNAGFIQGRIFFKEICYDFFSISTLSFTGCCAQISSLKGIWFFRKKQTILLPIWIQIFDKIKEPEAKDTKHLQFEVKL